MGCNYGIISIRSLEWSMCTKLLGLRRLVLISPVLTPVTWTEKREIRKANKLVGNYGEENPRIAAFKSHLNGTQEWTYKFEQTRDIANEILEEIKLGKGYSHTAATLVINSVGNPYVSPTGIQLIEDSLSNKAYCPNVETEMVESTMHNPLLSKQGQILSRRIADFVQ